MILITEMKKNYIFLKANYFFTLTWTKLVGENVYSGEEIPQNH